MKIIIAMFTVLLFLTEPSTFLMEDHTDKKLIVKEIEHTGEATLEEVSRLLEAQTELNTISVMNWDTFDYAPEVKFRIAHSNNQIWLKYYVKEEHILAKRTDINSSVSRDSCVEFFFDPMGDGNYYNFEFNCIGTPHLAYGPDRYEREFVDPKIIQEKIEIKSSLGNSPFKERSGDHEWEMTVIIPAEIFVHNKSISLKDLTSKANFYKCGDDTSKKHYLTWNPVGTPKPDYHRPEFFGELVFE